MSAAYFVPTHEELEDLSRAAQRGVDVRLLLPSHSDSPKALAAGRSYYGDLLGADVAPDLELLALGGSTCRSLRAAGEAISSRRSSR